MVYTASITSQGQLTVPSAVRKYLKIFGPTKVTLSLRDEEVCIRPIVSFWDLHKLYKSKIKLSDAQLRKARDAFEKEWARR